MGIKQLEKDLLLQCRAVLRELKNRSLLTYTRIHVMPVIRPDIRGKRKFTPNSDMVGFSDLEIVANGIIGYVELKTDTGTLTTLQENFLLDRKAHGAKTSVVRSVNELILFLEREMSVVTGYKLDQRNRPRWNGNIRGVSNGKRSDLSSS